MSVLQWLLERLVKREFLNLDLSEEGLRAALANVVGFAEEMVAWTETTIDDRMVEELSVIVKDADKWHCFYGVVEHFVERLSGGEKLVVEAVAPESLPVGFNPAWLELAVIVAQILAQVIQNRRQKKEQEGKQDAAPVVPVTPPVL